ATLPKRLSLMKADEFTAWLVGTEWEYNVNDVPRVSWFVTPSCQIFTDEKGTKKQFAFGYRIGLGEVFWYRDSKNQKQPRLMKVGEDLKTATLTAGDLKVPMTLTGRRHPPALEQAMTLPEFEEWMKSRNLKRDNHIWFSPDGTRIYWNQTRNNASCEFRAVGLVEGEWSSPMDRSLLVVDPEMKSWRWYAWWGSDHGRVSPKPGAPSKGGATIANVSAVTLKKRSASVGGMMVVPLGSSRYAGKTSKVSITAMPLENNSKPASIAFNQTVGADMNKALQEVSKYLTIRHEGWPRGVKMEVFFEDKYSPKDGPSAAVACALLLESLITGTELDPALSVTGDLNADGSVQPIGGVIAKLRGASKAGQKLAAIPQKNRTSALDLAVGEGAAPFIGVQWFSIDTFDEALNLARSDREPSLVAAIQSFDVLGATLKSNPAVLSSPAVRKTLEEILQAVPNHLSARLLLTMAEGRLPTQFSAPGSLEAVDQAVATVAEAAGADLAATSALDSGKIGAARNRLLRLRSMVDARVQPYVDSWIAWAAIAEQIISRRSAGPQVLQELKNAGSKINAEASRLRGNSEFMEELLK
ncbi:MAG: S16 family serine protease, partial [Verrucomicrobium sp.]